MNPHACTKFGANRSSRLMDYTDALIFDPLNPSNANPCGLEELIVFSLCPFPDESARVPNLVLIGPSVS